MKEDKYEALRAKAEVLIEALPYIQRFNRRIIVVKYGGSAMLDEELKQRVIQDVTLLKLVGFQTNYRTWWWERDQQMGGKSRNGTGVCKRSEKNRCCRQWKSQRWYLEKSENLWYPW